MDFDALLVATAEEHFFDWDAVAAALTTDLARSSTGIPPTITADAARLRYAELSDATEGGGDFGEGDDAGQSDLDAAFFAALQEVEAQEQLFAAGGGSVMRGGEPAVAPAVGLGAGVAAAVGLGVLAAASAGAAAAAGAKTTTSSGWNSFYGNPDDDSDLEDLSTDAWRAQHGVAKVGGAAFGALGHSGAARVFGTWPSAIVLQS